MKRVLVAFLIGIATVPLLLIICAWLGRLPVSATGQPPGWEEELAEFAFDKSLARGAKGLSAPLAPDEQTLLAGMKLYRDNCAGCHGGSKGPSLWGSRNFYPRVPQFSDHPPDLSAPEMYWITKHGIRYSGMGAWDGMMPDEDIWRVALFLSRLGSLPPAVDSAWRNPPRAAAGPS
jgi:mono/diheme cytochrome c family protein